MGNLSPVLKEKAAKFANAIIPGICGQDKGFRRMKQVQNYNAKHESVVNITKIEVLEDEQPATRK